VIEDDRDETDLARDLPPKLALRRENPATELIKLHDQRTIRAEGGGVRGDSTRVKSSALIWHHPARCSAKSRGDHHTLRESRIRDRERIIRPLPSAKSRFSRGFYAAFTFPSLADRGPRESAASQKYFTPMNVNNT